MSVWIKNFKLALENKQVIILYGNVRDIYIDAGSGDIFYNLTDLITNLIPSSLDIKEIIFYEPWKFEKKFVKQDGDMGFLEQSEAEGTQILPVERILAKWASELKIQNNKLISLFYLDKIVSYQSSYDKQERECLFWLEKIIENITEGNRLIIVSLQDSMLPVELYTHSPKCKIIMIPMPDKEDRISYLQFKLSDYKYKEYLDLIANLTDGLYLGEMDQIIEDIKKIEEGEISSTEIKKAINRYKIGFKQDYWAGIDIRKLNNAKNFFIQEQGLKGQDEAVEKIIKTLWLARTGLSGVASGTQSKPRGVLFFAGPTGVGKTFLAKKLALFLFGSEDSFIRLDMSEFKEEHTISRLIGSPPGYVGFDQGGFLTNAAREKPFSVILFDEIEKAHPKILDIFLQIIDDGRLSDSRGQTVFFTEAIIIFTSNIGMRAEEKPVLDKIINDSSLDYETKKKKIHEHFINCVENFFRHEISRPELLNRIGNNIVPFNLISDKDLQIQIVESHLKRIKNDFEQKYKNKGYILNIDQEAISKHLVEKHGEYMAQGGGRAITNVIENEIMIELARAVLIKEGSHDNNNKFNIKFNESEQKINVERTEG